MHGNKVSVTRKNHLSSEKLKALLPLGSRSTAICLIFSGGKEWPIALTQSQSQQRLFYLCEESAEGIFHFCTKAGCCCYVSHLLQWVCRGEQWLPNLQGRSLNPAWTMVHVCFSYLLFWVSRASYFIPGFPGPEMPVDEKAWCDVHQGHGQSWPWIFTGRHSSFQTCPPASSRHTKSCAPLHTDAGVPGMPVEIFLHENPAGRGKCTWGSQRLSGRDTSPATPPKVWFSLSLEGGQWHGDGGGWVWGAECCWRSTPVSHLLGFGRLCIWLCPQEPDSGFWGSGAHSKGLCPAEEQRPAFTYRLSERNPMILRDVCPQSSLLIFSAVVHRSAGRVEAGGVRISGTQLRLWPRKPNPAGKRWVSCRLPGSRELEMGDPAHSSAQWPAHAAEAPAIPPGTPREEGKNTSLVRRLWKPWMEDAKTGMMVWDRSGFAAMLSAIRLPPGLAPKRRRGVRAGGKRRCPGAACQDLRRETCLCAAFLLPERTLSGDLRGQKGCPGITRPAGSRAKAGLDQPPLV